MSSRFADLSPITDEDDVLLGRFLPKLEASYSSMRKKKEEFTADQARAANFVGLPLKMNHNRNFPPVGITIAARVRDGDAESEMKPYAQALFKLNREDYDTPVDQLSELNGFQRNALMFGAHSDLSLGHDFFTEILTNCGTMNASDTATNGEYRGPSIAIRKVVQEISTVDHGLRTGSRIEALWPSHRSLKKARPHIIRKFVDLYNYAPPPADTDDTSPIWPLYIDHLAKEVRSRLHETLHNNDYSDLLAARGTYAASANGETATAVKKSELAAPAWVMTLQDLSAPVRFSFIASANMGLYVHILSHNYCSI